MTEPQLRELPGVDEGLAGRIATRRFRTRAQFQTETGAPPSVWDGFVSSSRFSVRLYRRS